MRKVEEILAARLRGEDVTKDELTQMREATLNIVWAFPEICDQLVKDAQTKNLTVVFFDEVDGYLLETQMAAESSST